MASLIAAQSVSSGVPSLLLSRRFFAYWSKESCLFSVSIHSSSERVVVFSSLLSFSSGSVLSVSGIGKRGEYD